MKKILIRSGAITAALLVFGSWMLSPCAAAFIAQASAGSENKPVYVLSQDFRNPYALAASEDTSSLPVYTEESSNWAGYIDTPASGGSYTSVSCTWTVPAVTGESRYAAAAQWIGLGGVSSTDLLQIGTLEMVENGETEADIFYEKLPAASQEVLSVPAGTTVTMSIQEESDSSGTWALSYKAVTPAGQTETDTIPVTLDTAYADGIGTSAEWISEDPSNGEDRLYPLAETGTVSFSGATVNGQALESTGNTASPVSLVSGGEIVLAPSAIGSDDMSFSTGAADTGLTSSDSVSETVPPQPNEYWPSTSGPSNRKGQSNTRRYTHRGRGVPDWAIPQFSWSWQFDW